MTQPRILLIDDNPGDRALIIRVLRQELPQAEIREILEQSSLNRSLRQQNFDVVVTDFQIRWTTGLDVLIEVKQVNADIPVIMFTNTGTEEIAVEAMKLGLDDYILKQPSRYSFLPPAVLRSLERVETRRRAALLTQERFQALNESLQIIQKASLHLMRKDAQTLPVVNYQNDVQQIYQSAQVATHVVQELFRHRSSEQTDPGSL
jgi:DNA-binding NtrC family response regulator